MSLINDMLKDLEKRHAEEAYPKGVVLAGIGVHVPAARMRSSQWLFYLGGTLAVAILVFIFRDGFYPHTAPPSTGVAAEATEVLPAPVSEPPPSATPTPQPAAMVASIEPPADEALTPGAALDQSVAQDETDGAVSNSAATDSVKSDNTADLNALDMSQAPAPQHRAPQQDVKRQAGTQTADHGADAGDATVVRAAVQNPPDEAVVSSRQESPAAPVHLKRIHPLSIRDRARQLRGEALRLARRGDLDQAEDKLSKALSLEPRHVAARGALAGLMIQNGQLTQAAALLDRGLKLKPRSAALIELRARVYVMQGDNQRARMLLEEHAPTVSQDPEYHAMLAAVYQRLGDYDKAGAVYQQLVNEKPENGVWWLGLGLSMEATGRMAEARQAYEKAQGAKILSPTLRQFVKEKLSSFS